MSAASVPHFLFLSALAGFAAGIDAQKDEEHEREAPEGGTAIAEKRQRDADDGHKAHHHAHVNEDVEEEDAGDAVAVDAPEFGGLPLCQMDDPQDEGQEEKEHGSGPDEAFFFANGAEDEVGVLLGDVFEFGLRAVHEAFPLETAGTDGDFALVDIVACTTDIFFHAKQHFDAHLLMGLKDVVEGVVGCIEKRGRTNGEDGDEEVFPDALTQGLPTHIEGHEEGHGNLHPNDVEGNDEARDEVGNEDSDGSHGEEARGMGRAGAIDGGHDGGEEPNEQEHDKFANLGLGVGQDVGGETDADDEVGHGGGGGEEETAGHSFTVEHEEEGEIDERRTGFALHDNQHHREQDERGGLEEVAHIVERKAVAVDEFGHGQGGDAFGKFGRLQADGTKAYPGFGTLDVFGQKGGDEQHEHHGPVGYVGEILEVAVVGHEQEEAQGEGEANPHELLAGARAPAEEIDIADFMAGSADAEPAEGEQGDIDGDDHPVGRKDGIAAGVI